MPLDASGTATLEEVEPTPAPCVAPVQAPDVMPEAADTASSQFSLPPATLTSSSIVHVTLPPNHDSYHTFLHCKAALPAAADFPRDTAREVAAQYSSFADPTLPLLVEVWLGGRQIPFSNHLFHVVRQRIIDLMEAVAHR